MQSDIIARARAVPHLKLSALSLGELEALRAELAPLVAMPKARFDQPGFELDVLGITDYTDDPYLSGTYVRNIPNQKKQAGIKPTTLGRQLPLVLGLLDRLSEIGGRARLSCLEAGQRVVLHPHEFVEEFIVHIPIYTEPGVWMDVKLRDGTEHSRYYAPGEVWLFNNYHAHGVRNLSGSARYHLWCGFPLRERGRHNTRLLSHINIALEENTGEQR